jgi:TRAP-type mannitol/chloroaromatic compound transport system permease large subunit
MNTISVLLKIEVMLPFIFFGDVSPVRSAVIGSICAILNQFTDVYYHRHVELKNKFKCVTVSLVPVVLAYLIVIAVFSGGFVLHSGS